MNTKELVTKAIRAGIKYSEDTYWDEPKELDRMASTLSLGLITLTEERLREIILSAFWNGQDSNQDPGIPGVADYASRIMREVRGEGR